MQIYANKSKFKLNYLNAISDLSFKMKTVFETQECLLSTNYNEQFIHQSQLSGILRARAILCKLAIFLKFCNVQLKYIFVLFKWYLFMSAS